MILVTGRSVYEIIIELFREKRVMTIRVTFKDPLPGMETRSSVDQ